MGLPGKAFCKRSELLEGVVDGGIDRHAFPVGQQVHADEINMFGQLRMRQPDVPGLRGAHRLADRRRGPVEILLELLDGNITLQDDLVADEHPHDIDVSARQLDGRLELASRWRRGGRRSRRQQQH